MVLEDASPCRFFEELVRERAGVGGRLEEKGSVLS